MVRLLALAGLTAAVAAGLWAIQDRPAPPPVPSSPPAAAPMPEPERTLWTLLNDRPVAVGDVPVADWDAANRELDRREADGLVVTIRRADPERLVDVTLRRRIVRHDLFSRAGPRHLDQYVVIRESDPRID